MAKNNRHILKLGAVVKEELKNDSASLVTRESGRVILNRIEHEIRQIDIGETLILDFSDVRVIDYSCADEVIAKLLTRLKGEEYGNKYIILQNLSPSQKENIQVALEKKDLAILVTDNKKNWEVIGILNNYLLETLQAIMKSGGISTRQLSDKLKLELNTASTRLLNLHKARLVKKCEERTSYGRRQFVYRSLLLE